MEIMSADISKLAEALSKMQGCVTGVTKDKVAKAGSYSYKYADLADVWDMVRKPLAENGLSVTQTYHENDNHIVLITMLMHSSGQWIRSTLKIITQGLKIQQIGSEMTYNRRYALSAILGIAADDDDDGAAANEQPRAKKEVVKPEPAAPVEIISAEEAMELENLLGDEDPSYREDLLKYFSNMNKVSITNFYGLPRKNYEAALRSVRRRRDERAKKGEEPIPF